MSKKPPEAGFEASETDPDDGISDKALRQRLAEWGASEEMLDMLVAHIRSENRPAFFYVPTDQELLEAIEQLSQWYDF